MELERKLCSIFGLIFLLARFSQNFSRPYPSGWFCFEEMLI
jgi:hypothetical protein